MTTTPELERRRNTLSANWQAAYDHCVRIGLPVKGNADLEYLGTLVDQAVRDLANSTR